MLKPIALGALIAGLALAGCGPSGKAGASGGASKPGPAAAIARGVVDQDGGLIGINAPRDGVLATVLAQEGDRVVAGQTLATMDNRQPRLSLGVAQAEAGVRAAQVAIARAKMDGAARDASRLRRLAAQDAATRQDAEQAAMAARIARAEFDEAVQTARASAANARLSTYALDAGVLRAPAAGRILHRAAVAGASVTVAAPLFVLETDAPRVVRAEVDEAFADRVRPGMAATVSREFDDAHRYPARVLRVSQMFGSPGLADDPTARSDTRVLSVIVAMDGRPDLKLGQRVLVRFGP